jgi:lipopolysaccharide assembly outer membrane protein LptD (OstA)
MRVILFIIFFFLNSFIFASFESLITQLYLDTQKVLIFPSLKRTNATINGERFMFDLNNKTIVGTKAIKISYGNMITTSDKISYNVTSKKIKVEGNTLFKRDNLKLKSDSAHIQFPKFINAEGHVSLSYNTYMSSSDLANFNLDSQKITFIGDVSFFDKSNNDKFYGNKIIFDLVNEEILSVGKSRAKINTTRLNQ